METKISKSIPTPLYIQVADAIKEQIASGIYPPGSKLPKEAHLVEIFHTSRITLRAALQLLAEEGIVTKQHGIGTFVSDNKKTVSMETVQGFYSLLVKSGAEVKTQLLDISSVTPPREVIEALNISEPNSVKKMDRLFLVKDQPLALVVTHFNQDFDLTEEEAESITAYGLLKEKMNTEPTKARYHITTAKASHYHSQILSLPKGAPILVLNEISYNLEGQPLEHSSHFIRPDYCEIEFILFKNRPLEDLRILNVDKQER